MPLQCAGHFPMQNISFLCFTLYLLSPYDAVLLSRWTAKLETTFLLVVSFPRPFSGAFWKKRYILQNLTGKILPNANSASFHMSILLFQIRALLSSHSIFTWCFIYSFCFLSPRPPPPSASKFRRTSSTGETPHF